MKASRHTHTILLAAALAALPPIWAADTVWNGTTDALWSTGTNWSTSSAPGAGDTAIFNNAGNLNTSLSLGSPVSISSVVFDTADAAAYTVGSLGETLTLLDGGSIGLSSSVTANQTISANLVLGVDGAAQNYTISNNVPAGADPLLDISLIIGGSVSGGTGGTAGAKVMTIDSSSNHQNGVAFTGSISNGGAESLAIVKTGSGALNFNSGNHTFTGGVTVQAGTFTLSGSTVLPDFNTVPTSVVRLGSSDNTGDAVTVGVVNAATTPLAKLEVVAQESGAPTTRVLSTLYPTSGKWNGPISMQDDLTVGAVYTDPLAPTVAYNFSLGTSSIDLGDNNLTVVANGVNSVTISSSSISGTGGILVTGSPGGRVFFPSGANYTFEGGLRVESGTVAIQGGTKMNSSMVYLGAAGNTGSTVNIGIVNSSTNPVSPLIVVAQTSGEPTKRVLRTNASTSGQWNGPITMNSDLTVEAFNTNGTNVYNFTLNGGATVDLGANTLTLTSTTLGNVIANGAISGTGGIIVNNTSNGTTTLGGQNTFSGNIDIQSGTLTLANGANLGTGGLYSGNISISSANAGKLVLSNTGDNTLAGVISGSGALTKTGPSTSTVTGTTTLGGQNTYSGATSIQKGTLTIAPGASIAPTTGAALTVGGVVSGTSAPVLTYSSELLSRFGAIIVGNGSDGGGNAKINQSAGTITGTSLTLNNAFTGQGAGDVNLTGGTMAISGATTVSNTTFSDNIWSTITVEAGATFSTATLNFTGAPAATRFAAGRLTQNGGNVTVTGTLNLARTTATNTAARRGEYNLNSGILTVNAITQDTGADTFGTVTFNGGTLTAGASSPTFWPANAQTTAQINDGGAKFDTAGFDITVAQPLVDFAGATTATLAKQGLGTLTLAGVNTYTGATTVEAGTLDVAGSLGTSPVEVLSGASLAGVGSLGGSVTIRSGGRQAFSVAATAGAQTARLITGTLSLDAGNVIDLSAATAPAAGTYVLASASGGITGTPGTVNLNGIGGSVSVAGNNLQLTVASVATGYSSWLALYPSLTDTTPGGDPDNDGVKNLLEYVLNGNPTAADTTRLPSVAVTTDNYVFTFTRRSESATDTTQTFQYSVDLTNPSSWTDLGVTAPTAAQVAIGADTAGEQTVTVTLPKSLAVGGRLFGRLQVTQTP